MYVIQFLRTNRFRNTLSLDTILGGIRGKNMTEI